LQHVVSQLIEKRKELEGEAIHYQKRISEIVEQLKGIDSSIALFDPTFNPTCIRHKRFSRNERQFKRGEAMKLIFEVLKTTDQPMKSSEIGERLMQLKGFDVNDDDVRYRVLETIRMSLGIQEKKGFLIADRNTSPRDTYWTINQN
jgi:hypothetical protein